MKITLLLDRDNDKIRLLTDKCFVYPFEGTEEEVASELSQMFLTSIKDIDDKHIGVMDINARLEPIEIR